MKHCLLGLVIFIYVWGCGQGTSTPPVETSKIPNPPPKADLPLAQGNNKKTASDKSQIPNKEEQIMNVRESILAGSWYPSNPDVLKKEITKYLDSVKLPNPPLGRDSASARGINPDVDIAGLVVPHAGHQYSGQCAAYGYLLLKGKSFKRVIIMGPSHSVGFSGVSVTKATHYETPLGKIPVDRQACDKLLQNDQLFSYQAAADKKEHSVEIQLPFLQTVLSNYKIVPLVVGELDDYQATASVIKEIVDDQTLVIASSDFTHYGDDFGYVPFTDDIKDNLKKLDGGAIEQIVNISPAGFYKYVKSTGTTICGYKPISLLLSIIDSKNIVDSKGILLNYYTSGDLAGDYSHCVSYASIAFMKQGATKIREEKVGDDLDESEQKTLLKLTRETLRMYLKEGKTPKPDDKEVTDRLREKRGIFVTLKNRGELRGCIGRIFEPEPLYQEVIEYTVHSANDSRFYYNPVTAKEEKEITIEISVLSPMRKVDSYKDIIVGKHGVYLVKGSHNAVYLPQVAPEQGWTLEEMLNNLAEKARLPADGWRKGAEFFVFTAQVLSEKE
ncbi:MAG: AmmeMemoRadiSam system protein B [Planctomycetota bacterium]